MKVCKLCGRKEKGKRWIPAKAYEIEHEKLMGHLNMTHCPDCLRHRDSYNATLQIRGRFDKEKIHKLILETLKESDKKGERENVYVHGKDYRFTKKSMAKKVARVLADMGAEIIQTSKIVTYNFEKGKDVKRITISARFNILKGDVIKVNGKFDVVEKIKSGWAWTKKGNKLKTKDLKILPSEKLEGIIISEKPPLIFIKDTNQTLEIPHNLKNGDKVELVKHKDFVSII